MYKLLNIFFSWKTALCILALALFSQPAGAFFYSWDYYVSSAGNSYAFNWKIIKNGAETVVLDSYWISNWSYSANPSFNATTWNIVGTIDWIQGKTLAWMNFRNTVTGEKKTYYVNALSTFNPFIAASMTYAFSWWTASFWLIDPEYSFLTSTWAWNNRYYKSINTDTTELISDNNWENTFSLRKSGAIYVIDKKSKNWEVINTYTLAFKNSSNVDIANASINQAAFSSMYVAWWVIYVMYWTELYSSIMSGWVISVVDWVITIKWTWTTGSFKNLNGIVNTTDVGIVGIVKSLQKWNILYTLTNWSFQMDYVKSDSYGPTWMDNIFTIDVSAINISDFSVIDNNIILYSKTNWHYYINWDYILYSFYDNDNWTLLEKAIKNSFDYSTKPLYSKASLTKSSTIATILNIPFTNGWVTGTEKYIKDNALKVSIDPSKIIQNTFSKNIKIKKYSSLTFGPPSDVATKNITWTIPLIWYGIILEPSINTCNRTAPVPLNVPVSNTSKVYDVTDWTYCLYVSPYDEWYNTLAAPENVKMTWADIFVKTDVVVFWDPEIQRNVIWDDTKDIDFYIYSSKALKTMTVNYSDRYGWAIDKNLTSTGADRVQFVSSTNNTYKYVFHTNVADLNNTTTFNITGEDYYWNLWNLIYQYDLYKGYYQVLWLTQTNLWVKSDLSKEQSKKWFLYWLSSSQDDNRDNIQTLFYFDKANKIDNQVPTSGTNIINFDLLKFNLKDFRGRSKKDFTYDPNNTDFVFENGYYYYYNWDLTLTGWLNYYWNWVLLVSGKVKIKWDVTKNISTSTKEYDNSLKIYATDNIEVLNWVSRIDSDVFTNKTIATYATTNSSAIASWLGTFIDTNWLFIIWISKFWEGL